MSVLSGKDANSVPSGVEHIVTARVWTHIDRYAHAISLCVVHKGDDFFELSVGREALDACGRTRLCGQNIAVSQHAQVFWLATAAKISGLDAARRAKFRKLLPITISGFDRVPGIVWNPKISAVRLDVHLSATAAQLLDYQFRILQGRVKTIDAVGKVARRRNSHKQIAVRHRQPGYLPAPLF